MSDDDVEVAIEEAEANQECELYKTFLDIYTLDRRSGDLGDQGKSRKVLIDVMSRSRIIQQS